jgi:putative inorganic carbon (hco3(-)) transporter
LIASLATAIVVSVFYTPLIVVALLAVPAAIYFGSRPYELLLLMVFFIPFNFVFKVGSIPVAFELIKVLAWVPFLLTRGERGEFIGSRHKKYFAVWIAIVVFSLVRTSDFPYTVKECVRLTSNIGLCYLVINLVRSREQLLQVLRVLMISTLLVACYGFYQFIIQDYGALFWIVNPRLDTSMAHYRDTFWPWRNRIISVLTSEMELGHYFNMCLPIAVALWLVEGKKRLDSKWLLIAITTLLGLVLTFTFGAWLALPATMFLFVLVLDAKRRWKLVGGGFLAVALGAALIIGPLWPYVETKFTGMQIGSFAWDVMTRLKAWTFALSTWRSHPWLGVGIGNYETLSAESDWIGVGSIGAGSTPHETYFYILAESGLVGFIAMTGIMLRTVRSNLQLKNLAVLGPVAMALAFSITVNWIGGFSDDSPFVGPHTGYLLWLLVGLSEALRNLAFSSGTTQSGIEA